MRERVYARSRTSASALTKPRLNVAAEHQRQVASHIGTYPHEVCATWKPQREDHPALDVSSQLPHSMTPIESLNGSPNVTYNAAAYSSAPGSLHATSLDYLNPPDSLNRDSEQTDPPREIFGNAKR